MTLHVPLHPDRVVLARSRTAFALVTLVALLATHVTSLPAQAPFNGSQGPPPERGSLTRFRVTRQAVMHSTGSSRSTRQAPHQR